MKNKLQMETARKLAEVYAPDPKSSAVIYGIVATSVAGLCLMIFAGFYDLDALAYPLWVGVVAVLIFAGSMILRLHRARKHAAAHRNEYDKMDSPQ